MLHQQPDDRPIDAAWALVSPAHAALPLSVLDLGGRTIRLFPTAVNYREPTISPAAWCRQHTFERVVDQLADRPDMIGYSELHRGRDPQLSWQRDRSALA